MVWSPPHTKVHIEEVLENSTHYFPKELDGEKPQRRLCQDRNMKRLQVRGLINGKMDSGVMDE
jgi:hypothetical protein